MATRPRPRPQPKRIPGWTLVWHDEFEGHEELQALYPEPMPQPITD